MNKSKKLRTIEAGIPAKYLIGVVILALIGYGMFLYATQEDVVPAIPPSGGVTPTPSVTQATPARTATPPPTPPPTPKVTESKPTVTPTPSVTQATPPPTATAAPRGTLTPTANPTPIPPPVAGTIRYDSVEWSLSTGGTSTAKITFQIFGTWSGTIKAQVKKNRNWGAKDTVIGEISQYVSGTSELRTVTVSFPKIGETANAGDWVFIRVEGIYDEGGIYGGGEVRRNAGTEVQMPSIPTPSPTPTPAVTPEVTPTQEEFNVVAVRYSTSSGDANPRNALVVRVGTTVYFYADIKTESGSGYTYVDPNKILVHIKKDIVGRSDLTLNPTTGNWDAIPSLSSGTRFHSYDFKRTGAPFYLNGEKTIEIGSFVVNEASSGTFGNVREYFAKAWGTGSSVYNPTDEGSRNRVITS